MAEIAPVAPNERVSPRDIVASGLCIGCGGCVGREPAADRRMQWDGYGQLKPAAPSSWMRAATPEFSRTCPFSPAAVNEDVLAGERYPLATHADARIGRYEAAYVGAAEEGAFRTSGSSGGMVSWVAAELMRRGLVDGVAHVVPIDPEREDQFFRYRISRSVDEIGEGAKSRYYPVELSAVLREIRATPGRYAVIGVPCFIKAVHLLRRQDPVLRERIAFTLGLFCGHMKSARMVESFAWQMDTDARALERVEFRQKNPDRPANWYTAQLALADGTTRSQDWWHLADGDWGAGFFQNSACNMCDDVVAETADIAFGDAWLEPYSSDGRGTNVVIVRSPVVHDLIRQGMTDGRLGLQPVDQDFVVATQAAGFRQRREGLAYRLTWRRRGVRPCKRVQPSRDLPLRRKLIYRIRAGISAWSHRVFAAARYMDKPALYIGWARGALTLYHGLAYSRGRIGAWVARIGVLKDQGNG